MLFAVLMSASFCFAETQWPVERVLGTGRGISQGQMYDPSDVAVDSRGYAYVLEAYNGRIQVFSPDGSSTAVYGSTGNDDPGQLDSPDSIALKEVNENLTEIAVADTSNHRVQLFWINASQTNWTVFGEHLYGDYKPSSHIYLDHPRGVDLDASGNLYVSDTGDNRVNVFRNGSWLAVPKAENRSEINGNLTSEGVIQSPVGVAVEGGKVYIVESGADRIRGLYVNGSEFLSYGGPGSDRGQFNNPGAVALDHQGHLFVADTGNNRVEVFTTEGKYVASYGSGNCSIAIKSHPSYALGQFCNPRGLDVWNSTLFVVDSGNHRVQVINLTYMPASSCIMLGDNEPCGKVEVGEIISFIGQWAAGNASVSDVLRLIIAWASG